MMSPEVGPGALKLRFVFELVGGLMLVSCATTEVVEVEPKNHVPTQSYSQPNPKTITKPISKARSRPLNIDQVEKSLNMASAPEKLGYREKKFNPCKIDPTHTRCDQKYFSKVNFQILCRESEGTVEYVSSYELVPIASTVLEWRLGIYRGRVTTNSKGYGEVRLVSPGPSANQRFVLIKGKNSLGVRANGVTKIIVPRDWCD